MLWRLGIRWCITHIDTPGRKKNEGRFGERHSVVTLILENISTSHGSFIACLRVLLVAEAFETDTDASRFVDKWHLKCSRCLKPCISNFSILKESTQAAQGINMICSMF